MKKLIPVFFVCVLLLTSCGPTKDDAIKFNDTIVDKLGICTRAEAAFYDECKNLDSAKISVSLQTLLETTKKQASEIAAMEGHEKFKSFKESAVSLSKCYVTLEPDFREYARLYSLSDDKYTEQDEIKTKEVAEKLNGTVDASFKQFTAVQKELADKFGFIIVPNTKKY
jgi:hypothetical protein